MHGCWGRVIVSLQQLLLHKSTGTAYDRRPFYIAKIHLYCFSHINKRALRAIPIFASELFPNENHISAMKYLKVSGTMKK